MPTALSPITRFAPSPTGHLHIGGARTALFCWAYAKGRKGHFVLRIEDTDQARSSEASARGILEDLAWLGIHWDEGPIFQHTTAKGAPETMGGDPRHVGSFYQSQRLASYEKYTMKLIEEGKAYPAFESSEELEAKRRAAVGRKETYRYDRAALSIPLTERIPKMKAADEGGTPYVVRFRMPDEPVVVIDEVLGEVKYAAGEVDDFVIRKADGFPTYHFAVVVDDEEMGVTHVLRGQEHLNNTPRHVALQKALGFKTPRYAHMPLIFNMDSSKMSKRDKDKAARAACKKAGIGSLAQATGTTAALSYTPDDPQNKQAGMTELVQFGNDLFLDWLADSSRQLPPHVLEAVAKNLGIQLPEVEVHDFRKAGYLPEVICNFIALLGWSPGDNVEKFNMDFLAARFELERIGKTNAKFDRVKLLSFNTDAMAAMSAEMFAQRFAAWCAKFEPQMIQRFGGDKWPTVCEALRPRCKTFRDAVRQASFALVGDTDYGFDAGAVKKVLAGGTPPGLDLLKDFLVEVKALDAFDPVTLHNAVESFAARRSIPAGNLAQPLRVAVTGSTVSPPINQTLAILGKDSTIARIERCIRESGVPA
jgi:glutamyl/glutaminyl-tRNA synthetase